MASDCWTKNALAGKFEVKNRRTNERFELSQDDVFNFSQRLKVKAKTVYDYIYDPKQFDIAYKS